MHPAARWLHFQLKLGLRVAESLQLGYGRAPILIDRLSISLENARAGMAHYLGDKERGDARFC
jgi:hypothetical protein